MSMEPVAASDQRGRGENKRKAETVSDTNSGSSALIPSETLKKLKIISGSVKRGRSSSKEEDKLKDVVHLRARRGQATDSHSLAERMLLHIILCAN